jgi:hypothetical protein
MAAYKELDFNYDILGVTQEYGLDGFSTPQLLAFAIELYEAGILTDKDLPKFPSDSGERFFYLVEKIVRREGVGDALANGVYWAARQIGNGAEEYDHNTMKKFEQVPLKLKMINHPYFLMYATGEKMCITQVEGSYPQAPIADKKEREAFVKNWDAVNGSRAHIHRLKRLSTLRIGMRPCIISMTPSEPAHFCRLLEANLGGGLRITFIIYPISYPMPPGWTLIQRHFGKSAEGTAHWLGPLISEGA